MEGEIAVAVELGMLGSIEGRVDGRLVDLGPSQQRLLLAALLVDVNREVSRDQLADRIWGEEHAQRVTLYGYLSRLRKVLAVAEGVEIVRRPAGYVLTTDPAVVDLYRFRDLAAAAREADDDQRAAELFAQALGLWRGEALAGADTPWANMTRDVLRQERLAAELDCGEVRLRLGQHAEVLAGLGALAGQYPWDERLAGQLILALYRCGRTAEALGHYQRTHRALARDLGVEPGPELRHLHRQILTADPDLAWQAAGAAAGSPSAAAAQAASPVPRQLPAPPALFTGRARELDRLSAALAGPGARDQGGTGGTVVISAIGGTGGIGKTYLALHWAYRHLELFPDGQLYVNLRGFEPAAEPMTPSTAVCGFLDALGVAQAAVPNGLDAQAALYRSLVVGKRMLVVLDNARDNAQVLPLLPGSPSCTVLVTSRHRLTGLSTTHAARPLSLDAFPQDEARLLLARHLGEDRLTAEPGAVAALLEHCAGLPLALSITAARAAAYPDLPLAHLAEELAETGTRLDALDMGELTASLRAVFSTSHRALPPEAARAFALLGLAPGPDINLHAAASLIATTVPRARAALRTLEAAHLVQQHAPGRYRMHDLVHLYAAEHGNALDRRDRDAALRRLVDFYLHTAYHASLLWEPQLLFPVVLDQPAPGCVPHRPADWKAAWPWYDAERSCLLAIQRLAADLGWHTPAWQLPNGLFLFHRTGGDSREAVAMGRVALTAAEQLTDPRPKAATQCLLGYFCAENLQIAEAFEHLEQAWTVFEQTGDLPGQALAHHCFFVAESWAFDGRDPRRGLFHAEQGARLHHSLGNATGECYALSFAGWFHALVGEHEQARVCCERAVTLARTLGPSQEGHALVWLGSVVHRSGRYTEALAFHHEALALYRGRGIYLETVILENLGYTHRALGQIPEARQVWQHARDLCRARHRTTEAERVQRKLDALDEAPDRGAAGARYRAPVL